MNKLILLLGLIFFVSAAAFANDKVLTWEECIEIATKNNNNLKAAFSSERASHYLNRAAISGFLPQGTANLNSNRGTGGNSTNPSITSVQSNITQAYTGSVVVTQNVFAGFSDVGKFDLTKANNMVSKANINIVKAQASYDLKFAYENFAYAKESVELLDLIIKRREDNLKIIELRYKSGMENKGSLLLARSYLEQARLNRLQGSNLIETARAQLCRAIGTNDCRKFDIDGSVPTRAPPQVGQVDLKTLVESTPQHLQADAQVQAAKAGITIAQSTFLPTVNATATRGKRGQAYFPQSDYWSFAMNLSFPFFTGGKDYFGTMSAYSAHNAAKETLENTDQQILVNLQQAYNSYIEAAAKLKVDQGFREAASLRAEIARKKYNNGLLSFEDWDVIETDFINRQTTYLQTRLNRVTAESTWEQMQGKGVFN